VRRSTIKRISHQQLIDGIVKVNQELACRATGIIPAVRLGEEASDFVPEVHPKDLALRHSWSM